MAIDKSVQLRNPRTGKTATGYYGFSWDNLLTAGFVWLRRSPRVYFTYGIYPLSTLIAFGLFFVVPALSAELADIAVPVGDAELSGHALIGGMGMLLFLLETIVVSYCCNAHHTRPYLREGYEILPGINEKEARRALKLKELPCDAR